MNNYYKVGFTCYKCDFEFNEPIEKGSWSSLNIFNDEESWNKEYDFRKKLDNGKRNIIKVSCSCTYMIVETYFG